MAAAGSPIDLMTTGQKLASKGVSEAMQLVAECDAATPSPASFDYWRGILDEKLTLHRIIQIAQEATEAALRADSEDPAAVEGCLEAFERSALAIRSQEASSGEIDLRATLRELIGDYEEAQKAGAPRGLKVGFRRLDQLLGGLKPGQLVILAARPAVGKTALALSFTERIAVEGGQPVGFFSLEMTSKEFLHRLACSLARVDAVRLNEGRTTPTEAQRLAVAMGRLNKAPLHICDRGGLTLAQLAAQARRMLQAHQLRLLIVDYLGLLRSGERGRSRYEDTTAISNALKALAKELGLPLLVLAQLNRDTDREGREPRLSNLRDSGAIEQDADSVILLHRNEEQSGDAQSVKAIVAKNRSGPTDCAELAFHRATTRFEEVRDEL